jgi:small subunit ribosomal protein S9
MAGYSPLQRIVQISRQCTNLVRPRVQFQPLSFPIRSRQLSTDNGYPEIPITLDPSIYAADEDISLEAEKTSSQAENPPDGPEPQRPRTSFDPNNLPPVSTSHTRLVPASPSYFTSKPVTIDDIVHLQALLRAYQTLPTLPPSVAPRKTYKTLAQYRLSIGEEVPAARYGKIRSLLKRLNLIVPELMPAEVKAALTQHLRDIDPLLNKPNPGFIDDFGRALGRGRRKSARAQAWLVEGNGEVLINGKGINEVFGRVHDRESALWPLITTGRMARYNLWATCHGGGTTGWAESLAMAVGRSLLIHEPALKPALRRGKFFALNFILIVLC